MKRGTVSIGTNTAGNWNFGFPYVYHNNAWHEVQPYVYTGGSWQKVGGAGTNMVYFLTNTGDYLVDSTGGFFLVRQG